MRGVVDGLSPMGARTAIMMLRKRYLSCGTTDHKGKGRLMPTGTIALASDCVCAHSRRDNDYWDPRSRQGRLPPNDQWNGRITWKSSRCQIVAESSQRGLLRPPNGRVRQCRLAQGLSWDGRRRWVRRSVYGTATQHTRPVYG